MCTTVTASFYTRMMQYGSSEGGEDEATTLIQQKIIKVPLGLAETKLSNVVLPKPMSDFSTVFDAINNTIYISGGCDSINGNEYVMAEFGNFFSCNNSSKSHYKILVSDLSDTSRTNITFTPLADMPTERYRHTAVLIPSSQQIVLVGGRNIMDDSIPSTVDIYNILTDTWTSHNVTDTKYLLSDNTGLVYNDRAYIFGGWNGSYIVQSTSFYIEINNDNSNQPTITFTDIADLPTPRGDISSVLYTSPIKNSTITPVTYALVTGGFTHETLCNALDTVEQYNFDTNVWISETFDTLTTARGDKVLVGTSYTTVIDNDVQSEYTQHLIYALGGERPIENICEALENNETLDVGSETVPIDDIEYYNVLNNTWATFPNDIDVYRFRFSAAVDPSTKIIYTLGGQLKFNKSCTCFPTSNEIYMYTEIFDVPAAAPSVTTSAGRTEWTSYISIGTTMTATVMIMILK